MKLFPIIFLLLLVFKFGYAQEFKTEEEACNYGTEKAIADAKKGDYQDLKFGLYMPTQDQSDEIYINILKTKYGITVKNTGCQTTPGYKCYVKKMTALIYEKFGSDVFERTKQEAIKLYVTSEDFQNNIKPKIDANKAFGGYVYKEPQFRYGADSLIFYRKHLNKLFNKSPKTENFKGSLILRYTVEKDGSMSAIEPSKDYNNDIVTQKAIELLKTCPNWIPGNHYGFPVRVTRLFYFMKH